MIDTSNDIRIISLIPSATEIIAKLGLFDAMVGRSHECDYPPEIVNLPVCTQARLNGDANNHSDHNEASSILQSALGVYKIKIDVLEKLHPTHIITQDQCDICSVSLPEVEKAVAQLTHSSPQIISLQPNTLQDLWGDIERVSHTFGVDSVQILENLEARVRICKRRLQGLSLAEMPKVACIEWTDPLMTAANWVPELINLAGGQPLFSLMGKPTTRIKWETLVASNPDVIIFMPCGFDLQRTQLETDVLTQRPEWKKLHAVQSGRVFITDGNAYFNRPGPRLVDSLEILAEILHPDIFDYGYKGTGWKVL
ncbi:cobalamin-binding protein [Dolichospermum sp. ST_con]|nr:cobalamin-binding protein [Dolichospermum sp. ST_con]MDD1418619.1 cobalamin-binding protein [Dolichospermum sp. ST_sed1]MDD1425209.1 cobalamin-binding protein [Dolichospermum sp. ST_sed9]MDD1429972.1 cobalamin-binding protein [Dolichospermum sp. ST_sed6]MDD1439247.1 cobalamin-binding protein [Dolichospermum sp. ST_sed3]MDD1445979.1 cobalamin-binding protein [Dolichospermum sp. ST_sed8]MDD1454643.1 cobalamin-binding protein [Dolichospermum sp. ST_sed7]MDD1459440.1 cobalamin-binding protein